MNPKDWAYLAAILFLSVLLLRAEFCKKRVKRVNCEPVAVNWDSLKNTIPRDSVLIPGPQEVIEVPVTLSLKDTAAVDSLLAVFEEQEDYYAGLVYQLRTAIKEREEIAAEARDSMEHLEMLLRSNVWADSAQTESYFLKWRIEAEGPITSFSFSNVPVCPSPPQVKKHRIGGAIGLQTDRGTLRQLYSLGYGYKAFSINLGYLPPVKALSSPREFQVTAGVAIPIK